MADTVARAMFGFKVEGLRQMVRDLEAMGVEVEDLKDAFSAIASEGARVAAGFVHSRSGTLAGSLRGNRAKGKAVIAAGGARVSYAGPQNYGWVSRNIPAQGFMQRADQVMAPRAIDLLEQEINDIIRRKGLS